MKKAHTPMNISSPEPRFELLPQIDLRLQFEFERLLKTALPRAEKVHQLVKTLRAEEPHLSYSPIKEKILTFYHFKHHHRTSSQFHSLFKIRPYPWLLDQFVLNFSSAEISDTELLKLASNLSHNLKRSICPPEELGAVGFLHLVLYRVTHPRHDQINTGLDFRDFAQAWQQASFQKWGDKFDFFFRELREFYTSLPAATPLRLLEGAWETAPALNRLDLTQTDLDWMKSIIKALSQNQILPPYPLSRGPQRAPTRHLERIVRTITLDHSRTRLSGEKRTALKHTAKALCLKYLEVYGQQIDDQLHQPLR